MTTPDLDPQQLQQWIAQQTTGWTADERAALNERVTREATRIRISRTHPTAGALATYIDPNTIQTPALDVIDTNLEWALHTRDARLLITVAPQEGKSSRLSVWGSVRALQLNPDWRIVLVSYAEHIARTHSHTARNIIREHGSEARDPITGTRMEDKLGLALASDKSAAGSWSLKGHRGGMFVGGLTSGITGKSSDLLIIDDPLKDMQAADSAVEQRKVINFWEAVAQTRLAPGAPVIIIQTRWSELDLAGHVLSKDELLPPGERQWRWINIPAISETGVPDALNRSPGVAMVSARGRTHADFVRIRRDVGERVWAGLYQGVPTPTGGGLFSKDWFDRHRVPEVGPTSIRIVSIDPAETGTRDEAGIIAAAATTDGRVRWTDDWSGRMRSDEWSLQAVVLALTTGATEITFEAYTTAQTYERVIKQAWKQVRGWGKLIRDLHSVDAVIAAFDTIPDNTSPDPNVLRQLDGVMVPDTDDPPFVIHPYRGRGDKVARAAGARQAASTGRLAVVGTLSELERQAVRWQQGMSSPDRMDAAVNAYERLMELIGGESVIASPYSTPPPQPAVNGVPAPAPTTAPSLAAFLSSPMNATNNA